jgi:hypothetical protein
MSLTQIKNMKKSTHDLFIELFFNKGEEICVSPNKFGYYSVSQDELLKDSFTIVSCGEKMYTNDISINDINLCSINPVLGARRDENVTAYRSFLVEIDFGSLAEQKTYIDAIEMPYSICTFSGNKSLHYGIVLSEDLSPSVWRNTAEWILAIANKADQQTKNPTRCIRFPDNVRKDGKKLPQSLVDYRGRISPEDLFTWLSRWSELNPALKKKTRKTVTIQVGDLNIPEWIVDKIKNGFDEGGRNKGWFCISIGLAKLGWSEDKILDALSSYFIEDRDFKEKEWEIAIKSGCKFIERMGE